MYMLNMVIILIVMYCNVVTAIDKIPTYLLRFNIGIQRVNIRDSSLSLCLLVSSRKPFRRFHAHAFSFHLLAQYARGVTRTKTVSPASGKRL